MGLCQRSPKRREEPDQPKAQDKRHQDAEEAGADDLGAALAHLRRADLQAGDEQKEQHADGKQAVARDGHRFIRRKQTLIGAGKEQPKHRGSQNDPADQLTHHRGLAKAAHELAAHQRDCEHHADLEQE